MLATVDVSTSEVRELGEQPSDGFLDQSSTILLPGRFFPSAFVRSVVGSSITAIQQTTSPLLEQMNQEDPGLILPLFQS